MGSARRLPCARAAVIGLLLVLAPLGAAGSAEASLNESINLVDSSVVVPTPQWDWRWGGFPVGPSPKVTAGSKVNFARCGCALTSLSMILEFTLGASNPWFAHQEYGPSSFKLESSFAPKYLDDYLNVGPTPNFPRSPLGWGFSAGGG